MYENAYEILNYLPIDADTEKLYINSHLFATFQIVNEEEEPVRAFSILPFHLLFMFAVQYKVYRISAYKTEEYLKILESCNLRDKGNKEVLEKNPPIVTNSNINISSTCSVRNLSLIPEKQIFDFLKIIDVDQETIKKAKKLVEIRGTYAHANGQFEKNIEDRIEEYLEILKTIQLHMAEINKNTQNWIDEIEEGESLEYFFNGRLSQSQFSPYDFGDIVSTLLESDILSEEQWYQVVDKGLELSYSNTISALRYILINSSDSDKKVAALNVLQKEGDVDEGM